MAARDDLDEEFREFVAARSFALLRTAYLLCGDWTTAEDLLQTALTKTYLAWKRLGEIEAVEPYARRVLVNTATSWWRRRWHGERPTDVLPERAEPDRIDEHVERDALWRHVQALPTRQRAVLVLRFYEDLTETQTASLLNISTGTVKSQTFRALNTLRRRLGAEADQLAPRLSAASANGTSSPAPAEPTAVPGPTAVPAVDSPSRPADLREPVGGSPTAPRPRHEPVAVPAVTLRAAVLGEAP
ncbi:MAG TPA: SigE family RNA polymerase sigma factor [Micromonosporaceae bacterium]|nr:SigE family RNA polymerase sigma factor [Micromonosporaceae bacterium]